MSELVSFYAKTGQPSPDAWTWQDRLSYRIRVTLAFALLIAGLFAAGCVLVWNTRQVGLPFATLLTAFLVGLMPARFYFEQTHSALANWALRLWVCVLAFTMLIACVMVSPQERVDPESVAALDHEQEIFNARNLPPRQVIEAWRRNALDFCPDYERWWTYVFPLRACWDVRKFERWLDEYDRAADRDRKAAELWRRDWKLVEASGGHRRKVFKEERNVADASSPSWWPEWSYLANEAYMLPLRLIVVAIAATALWGFVEAWSVILRERPAVQALPASLPVVGPKPQPKDQMTIMKEGFDAWRKACVGQQDGNVLWASDVYNHYVTWVTRVMGARSGDILADNTFGMMMRGVATSFGKAGSMKYGGISITDSQGIWNEIEKLREGEESA